MWKLREMKLIGWCRFVIYVYAGLSLIVLVALILGFLVFRGSYTEQLGFYGGINSEEITKEGVLQMIEVIGYLDHIIRSLFEMICWLSILHVIGWILVTIGCFYSSRKNWEPKKGLKKGVERKI